MDTPTPIALVVDWTCPACGTTYEPWRIRCLCSARGFNIYAKRKYKPNYRREKSRLTLSHLLADPFTSRPYVWQADPTWMEEGW